MKTAMTKWILLPALLCLLSPASAPGAEGRGPAPGPLVSIVFDDGWLSAYTYAIPIMEKYGFRGTHFIHADYVDKPGYQSDYMTSEQLRELYKKGHEIGSHALSIEWAEILSDRERVEQHLWRSQQLLNGFGFNVQGFAPPNGAYNPGVKEQVKRAYRYMRTIQWGLNELRQDPYDLHCHIVIDTTSHETMMQWIGQAMRENKWIILLYHRLDPSPKAETFVTPARFDEDMAYLRGIRASVLPVGEVFGVWKPFTRAD